MLTQSDAGAVSSCTRLLYFIRPASFYKFLPKKFHVLDAICYNRVV